MTNNNDYENDVKWSVEQIINDVSQCCHNIMTLPTIVECKRKLEPTNPLAISANVNVLVNVSTHHNEFNEMFIACLTVKSRYLRM